MLTHSTATVSQNRVASSLLSSFGIIYLSCEHIAAFFLGQITAYLYFIFIRFGYCDCIIVIVLLWLFYCDKNGEKKNSDYA